jgi:hypothetical protein
MGNPWVTQQNLPPNFGGWVRVEIFEMAAQSTGLGLGQPMADPNRWVPTQPNPSGISGMNSSKIYRKFV